MSRLAHDEQGDVLDSMFDLMRRFEAETTLYAAPYFDADGRLRVGIGSSDEWNQPLASPDAAGLTAAALAALDELRAAVLAWAATQGVASTDPAA